MTAALDAYAAGRGAEHAVLAALDASRLLVPVVAVLTPGQVKQRAAQVLDDVMNLLTEPE